MGRGWGGWGGGGGVGRWGGGGGVEGVARGGAGGLTTVGGECVNGKGPWYPGPVFVWKCGLGLVGVAWLLGERVPPSHQWPTIST